MQTRSKVSIDIGNGYCVAHDGTNTYSLRSLFHALNTSEQPEPGDRIIRIGAQRWVMGQEATFYRNTTPLAEGNKLEMALPFTIATLGKPGAYDLVVSVPDRGRYGTELTNRLQGVHHWSAADGNEYTTDIRVSRTLPEGFGSFIRNRDLKLLPGRGATVVIDIGAGTYCALAIDNKTGRIIEQMAVEQAGVIRLCNDIKSDPELKKSVGDELNLRYILDGITDGSFEYGETGVSFRASLQERLKPWFQGIVRQVKSQFHPHLPSVKKFLFTGGGTMLVKDRIKGEMFQYANNPLLDNAIGGYHA